MSTEREETEEQIIENIPLESSDDEVYVPLGKKERQLNRRAGIQYLVMLILVFPITLIPSLILIVLGKVQPLNILQSKLGNGPDMYTELARFNLLLSLIFFGITSITAMSFAVPRIFDHPNMFQVRKYFVVMASLTLILLLGGVFVYESTLVKDISVISSYVKQRPKQSSSGSQAGDSAFASGFIFITERLFIALIIIAAFLGLERFLIEKIKLAFHQVSFAKRLEPINEKFYLLSRCFRRLCGITKHRKIKERTEFLEEDQTMPFETKEDVVNLVQMMFPNENYNLNDLKDKLSGDDAKELFKWLADSDILKKETALPKLRGLQKEREQAKQQYHGNNAIIKKLHTVTRFLFFLIGGIFAAPFFDFGSAQVWATYGVLSATLGFLFKGAAKTAFEAMILVFVRHPYDVGDVVRIDGMKLKVVAIKVFTTQFEKCEEGDLKIYIPNSRIMDKNVVNLTRQSKN